MTALGAVQQILFVDVSPPASLFDSSLCHDMLSLSDAHSQALTGLKKTNLSMSIFIVFTLISLGYPLSIFNENSMM